MSARIVSDSSSNLYELAGIDYRTVPLKVMFGGHEYVDELGCDCAQMIADLHGQKGPSTTSCPNPQEWISAFSGADEVYAVTISKGLSGSYDAAEMARQFYLAEHPEAKVHIFNSKATGPVLHLIIDRLAEGICAGNPFDEVVADVEAYQQEIRILYSLESLTNLARNGRVNAHVARIAGALNIRVIGHASEEGTVELLHKCRGERRALRTVVDEMCERGYYGSTVYIDHCQNAEAAGKLSDLIHKRFPVADVRIGECGALCSYYADAGGLIVGYEVDTEG